MTTEFIHTDEINDEVLARAGAIIRRGGLVVFPTETVYGLGANALDAEAAKKVYAARADRPTTRSSPTLRPPRMQTNTP